MNNESEVFYTEALQLLQKANVPFMLGGAFALFHYTGLHRDTKDLEQLAISTFALPIKGNGHLLSIKFQSRRIYLLFAAI